MVKSRFNASNVHWSASLQSDCRKPARKRLGLALGLLVFGASIPGCEPERPLKTPDKRTVAAQGGAGSNLPSQQNKGEPKPRGPITTDKDGFVTLGAPQEIPSGESAKSDTNGAETTPTPISDKTSASPAQEISLSAQEPRSADSPIKASVASTKPNLQPTTNTTSSTPASALATSTKSGNETNSTNTTDIKSTADKTGSSNKDGSAATVQPGDSDAAHSLDEKKQLIARDWPKPQALLFISGQQHGYIEPCGCTGLENQKGGLNRRDTLLTQLRDRGWDVIPMDVGNFERRTGIQAEIKLQTTVKALNEMKYRAVTLGVDDLKLSSQELLALTASEGKVQTPFISANAYILIQDFMPKYRIIEAGGRKIGVTAVLGDSFHQSLADVTDVILSPAADALRTVMQELKSQKCDYIVLLSHAKLAESKQLAVDVPGFDLVISAGDYPEPDFNLEEIEGSPTRLIQVGAKGMFTTLVGLYPDSDRPVRYQRIALSSQFEDSPRMMKLFGDYQKQLQSKGLSGLNVPIQALENGLKFVGSESCGDCHTKAFEVWKNSEHFTATESLVHPPNSRSMIPRHYDPECLSCHVTGWNPQRYYPYASGFESLEKTAKLIGNGCENCHGPGSAHVAAENGDVQTNEQQLKELREKMRLPLAEARDKCLQCHDQDNSPEFQHEGSFEEYWQQIAHPGKD